MYTSSKLRRLRRLQQLKKQRRIAFFIVIAVALVITNITGKISGTDKTAAQDGIEIVVTNGDTLWTIASEYKPAGKDLRKFIHEISEINRIENATIFCGQTLTIPVAV